MRRKVRLMRKMTPRLMMRNLCLSAYEMGLSPVLDPFKNATITRANIAFATIRQNMPAYQRSLIKNMGVPEPI